MRCFSGFRFLYLFIVFGLLFAFASGLAVSSFFSSQMPPHYTSHSTSSPSPSVYVTPTPFLRSDLQPDHTASFTPTPSSRVNARVLRIVDGDTIEIEGGAFVRYIGVDTPESAKPNSLPECFGKEASAFNASLVLGKFVELEKDVSETDRYGRLLRYVFVDSVFVNHTLVARGYAHAVTYPPDVKYQSLLIAAQQSARAANAGLWGACSDTAFSPTSSPHQVLGTSTHSSVFSTPFLTPSPVFASPIATPFADTNISVSPSPSVSGCVIKGNISSSGKIYHLPGCASYDITTIRESEGERWFCTEEEARAAGWRKAKNC